MPGKAARTILEIAEDQLGYFTAAQARTLKIDLKFKLKEMVYGGKLEL